MARNEFDSVWAYLLTKKKFEIVTTDHLSILKKSLIKVEDLRIELIGTFLGSLSDSGLFDSLYRFS